tara:strand:+ start:101 stop:661 length:561 start_codon:yes stop_codon:yes gene_type:complete
MHEVENILRILREARDSIKQGKYSNLSGLSNQTINVASFAQDPDNIIVSVIVYSLSKILVDPKCCRLPVWDKVRNKIILYLDHSIQDIEKNNMNDFRKDFEKIRKELEKLSKDMKEYVKSIFKKASLNKASRIYEHGVSMEQTAKLLGVSMFELANYAGGQYVSEAPENRTFDEKSRIKLAEGMFL